MLQIQYGLSKKQMYTSSRSLVSLIVSPLHLPAPHFSQSLQDSHASQGWLNVLSGSKGALEWRGW